LPGCISFGNRPLGVVSALPKCKEIVAAKHGIALLYTNCTLIEPHELYYDHNMNHPYA